MQKRKFVIQLVLLFLVLAVCIYYVIILSFNLYDDIISNVNHTVNLVGVILFSIIIGFDLGFIIYLCFKRKLRKRYYTLKK